jgi:hypothetical protein
MNKTKCAVLNCNNMGKYYWQDTPMKVCKTHHDKANSRDQSEAEAEEVPASKD